MRPHAETVDTGTLVGYRGADGAFYCSAACAEQAADGRALPVDIHESVVLFDRDEAPHHAVCPQCDGDYPPAWTDEDDT